MSDLISRQAVINAIANTCFWLSADNWEELTKCINSIPSADIIEHTMAIKEYCEHFPECEGCRFYNGLPFRCTFGSCPQGWDLPEGEKGGNNDNT